MSFLNWSSSFYGAKVFLIKSITLRVWKKVDLAGASSLRLMKLDLAGASSLRFMKVDLAGASSLRLLKC